jgi:hypothetical protein
MYKRIMVALIAFAIALFPALTPGITSAANAPHNATYDGINFTGGTNACTGTIIGVYGSSALKNYVLGVAADFCAAQTNAGVAASSALDVEYAGGGDSCPGVDMAADDTTDPVVGVSDVFASGCTGSLARSATKIKDNNAAVNIVDAITYCGSTVTAPQGGDPYSNSLVACTGAAPTTAGNGACASTLPAATFPYPNDVSILQAQNLWNPTSGNAIIDLGQIGGCAGISPAIQIRTPGSGTRATWCYNVYGVGIDNCNNNSVTAPASGSGAEVGAICGNPYASGGPASPTDAVGTIGHTSRATIVIDPNKSGVNSSSSLENTPPIQNCGIVSLGGHSGWNQNCDPYAIGKAILASTTVPTEPNSGTDTNGVETCNGDLEVSTGAYQVWGYEHFDTSSGLSTSSASYKDIYSPVVSGTFPVGGFLTFVLGNFNEEVKLEGFGFMRGCQTQVKRTVDAGPYSVNTNYSC